ASGASGWRTPPTPGARPGGGRDLRNGTGRLKPLQQGHEARLRGLRRGGLSWEGRGSAEVVASRACAGRLKPPGAWPPHLPHEPATALPDLPSDAGLPERHDEPVADRDQGGDPAGAARDPARELADALGGRGG